MLSPLNERLDEVGWDNSGDWRDHTGHMFKWMEQATVEIDRLTGQVSRLESEVATLRRQVPDDR